MDIYRFIDSRAIRNHLRELDYAFTTQEAAFLVWYCRSATLEEKIQAWEEIIDTMPNCSLDARPNMEPIPDFHAFLDRYIRLKRRDLNRLRTADSSMYSYELQGNFWGSGAYSNGIYTSYNRCVAVAVAEAEGAPSFTQIAIVKRNVDPEEDYSTGESCTLNSEGEVMSVDCYSWDDDADLETEIAFQGMWMEFPTPFHAGDIVCSTSEPDEPFVLGYLCTWDEQRLREEVPAGELRPRFLFHRNEGLQRHRANGDVSDMWCPGYGVSTYNGGQDVLLWNDDDFCHTYLDVDYFDKPLEGKYQLLKPVSKYLKREYGIESLINGYCTLFHKMVYEDALERLSGPYLPGFFDEIGLPAVKEGSASPDSSEAE